MGPCIRSFDELDGNVLADMRRYMKKPHLSRAETIRIVKRKFSGWVRGNNIYFKVVPSKREMMDTIIHEYVHWVRKQSKVYRYRTDRQKLLEESLATYFAEKMTGRRPKWCEVVRRTARKYHLVHI